MSETKMCACGSPDGTNQECERCSLIHLRGQVADLKVENVRLRKIMCYVPAKIAIKAKEAAGFGNVITLAEMTEECDHEWEVDATGVVASRDLGRIRSSAEIDRNHCKSMADHYCSVDKNQAKWHYWIGCKQICDDVIAQIDAELLPKPKIENVHPYDSHEPRDYA